MKIVNQNFFPSCCYPLEIAIEIERFIMFSWSFQDGEDNEGNPVKILVVAGAYSFTAPGNEIQTVSLSDFNPWSWCLDLDADSLRRFLGLII